MHAHGGFDVVVAVALRRDLQGQALPLDAVVTPDLAVLLDAEHVLERAASVGDEGRSRLGRGDREAGIVVWDEALLEIALAASTVAILARRSSGGNRLCKVPKTRSIRPRASGE